MKEDIDKIRQEISDWRSTLRGIKCDLCSHNDYQAKEAMFDFGVLSEQVKNLANYLDKKYEPEEEENG